MISGLITKFSIKMLLLPSPLALALLVLNVTIIDLLQWLNFSVLQKDWVSEMGLGEEDLVNPDCQPLAYRKDGYKSFEQFYPYYLGEHHERLNRRLHLIGTTNSVAIVTIALVTGCYPLILLAVVQAYGMAWIGHFFVEKNKPATFKHPFYSLMGDFRMWWEVISGRRKF